MKRFSSTGNYEDQAKFVGVDGEGNVYVTGWIYVVGHGPDIYTIKYNPSGAEQWNRTYNGPGNGDDFPQAMYVDNSGNVFITGSMVKPGGNYDYITIKYNSAGIQLWAVNYDGTAGRTDLPYAIAVDSGGNVYITGTSMRNSSYFDILTIKYTNSGILQWLQVDSGSSPNSSVKGYSIALDRFEDIVIAGDDWYLSGQDFRIVFYSKYGVRQWFRRVNGTGNSNDEPCSISSDQNGNVYVTGFSRSNGIDAYDFMTVKLNSFGDVQWTQFYNGPGNELDKPSGLAKDLQGNIYVSGISKGNGTGRDYCTIKYNPAGTQQWTARYNGPGNGNDEPTAITTDSNNNIYITGFSRGIFSGYDYCTVKYNSSGMQQWTARYNTPYDSTDNAYSVAIYNRANIYVTGKSFATGSNYDYCVVKYTQPIGIYIISNAIPETFSLYQNYPNPFNPITKIKFAVPPSPLERAGVRLVVYDALGREVQTLVNEQLQPGTYEVEFDGSKYSSGVYYYTLQTDDYIETKKMIILK